MVNRATVRGYGKLLKSKAALLIFISCILMMAFPVWGGEAKPVKLNLWSKCFDQHETCIQINLEKDVKGEEAHGVEAVEPEFDPPTFLEEEEVTISVDVTSDAVVAEGEDIRGDLQPVQITPLESHPLIERAVVTQEKLKEVIGDPEVIKRLLKGRSLEKLAITVIRQDFEVLVKKLSGETIVSRKASINIAKAEEAGKEKPIQVGGCPVPEGAERVLPGSYTSGTFVAYTLPKEKRPPRKKEMTQGWDLGSKYFVGPRISYFDKEGKRKRLEECYNRYAELDGRQTKWYKNGKKELEYEWKDGKRHGRATAWYENGKKKSEENYKEGKKNGRCSYWLEDGHKWKVENYKNGVENGLCTYWGTGVRDMRMGKRGVKLAEKVYENGQVVKETNYYYKSGKKISETHYKDGKKNGTQTLWNAKGQMIGVENYRNGKQHGESRSYLENGQLYRIEHYNNGKRNGIFRAFYSNGELCQEVEYSNDVLVRSLHPPNWFCPTK